MYFKTILHDINVDNVYFDFRSTNRKIISFLLQMQKKVQNMNVGDNFRYLQRMDEKVFFKKSKSFEKKRMRYKEMKLCLGKNTNKISYFDNNINIQQC